MEGPWRLHFFINRGENQLMGDSTAENLVVIVGILGLLMVVQFLWTLIVQMKLTKLRKRYTQMMNETGVDGLERILLDIQERMDSQQDLLDFQQVDIKAINEGLRNVKGHIGIHRYNTFAEGSDMSFSVAIINELQDGIVFSGIQNRENMYVYAKPLQRGESTYVLTDEEKTAITLAVQQV
ncbi:DUF4446 family protein [Paenibacillaceae bacterium]|nr:DUF4446 family protein [Paenibacillaceae bacterium]